MEDEVALLDEVEMLKVEIKDLKEALSFYADERNWHDQYELPYYRGPKYNLVWARNEDGWELAKQAIGDY